VPRGCTAARGLVGWACSTRARSPALAEREAATARARQEDFDQYVRSAAGSGGASAGIERAKALLDSGAITPEEYEQLKRAALA
jgi:hypothetical protein